MVYKFNGSNHVINLIEYVPDALKSVLEMNEIMVAETSELKKARQGYEDIFADQYINESTDNGLRRWEKILKIPTRVSDGKENRRFKILSKLMIPDGYTEIQIKQLLIKLCGEGNVDIELNYNAYKIWICIKNVELLKLKLVYDLIYNTIPANLILGISTKAIIKIGIKTEVIKIGHAMCGSDLLCGTYPYTVKDVGFIKTDIKIKTANENYKTIKEMCGTVPNIVSEFVKGNGFVKVNVDTKDYIYSNPLSGKIRANETPYVVSNVDLNNNGVGVFAEIENYAIVSERCGEKYCGE